MQESSQLLEVEPEKARGKILPKHCPICGVDTNYVYLMVDKHKDEAMWYRCQCGCIFQENLATHDIYDAEYITSLSECKQSKDRYEYMTRVYAPLIEELSMGRMMLEVGYAVPYLLKSFEDRGWLTWAIDVNPTITGQGNIYNGDFMTYDFSLPIKQPEMAELLGEKVERKFDLIWMGHVLEHFADPITALNKAYNLLAENGMIFISTPDIDFINKTGLAGWGHFNKKEHNILWSEMALRRELERIGFKVVMMRRNFSSRFMSWYDIHCICQKNYF